MSFIRFGGQYEIEDRGRLFVRAARLGRHLLWPSVGALLAAIFSSSARLLGPIVVRGGIDNGIGKGDTDAITVAAVVFGSLLLFQYVTQCIAQYAISWVGERFLLKLRSVTFAHLMRLDAPFYDKAKTGVLVSRMTSDVEALTEFVNEGAVLALTNALTVFGVAIAILILDWRLALITFAVIGLLLLCTVIFQKQVGKAYEKVREYIAQVLAILQEGITGIRVVQAFTQESAQTTKFGRANERHFEANMAAARAMSWYFPSVAFLRVVAMTLALLFGGFWVMNGDLTAGTLVAFLLYLDWLFHPIINLANVYNLLQASLAALGKLYTLLDTPPMISERPGAYDLPMPLVGELRLDGVTFGYGNSPEVIKDISLVVPPGQRLALVGETGAGKSTIAKLLLRLYDPTAGSVCVDGHDLRDLTFDSRATGLVLVPQDGFLFNTELRENLRYGRPGIGDREIMDALRTMGIIEWFEELPEGLDTPVRERGNRFSAGERQLIALTRAFLLQPGAIVLDEATSSLDPETEVRIEKALRVLLDGRTVVVIAHRLRSAERADRVVMMAAGRITADGTHGELLRSTPEYRELVEVWERGNA